MNKPIKEYIIENMDISYPKELIEKVIAFQGEDMLRASREYREIEISGFGLFYVAQGKLNNHIARMEKTLSTVTEKAKLDPSPEAQNKIKMSTDNLEYLKSKLKCQS